MLCSPAHLWICLLFVAEQQTNINLMLQKNMLRRVLGLNNKARSWTMSFSRLKSSIKHWRAPHVTILREFVGKIQPTPFWWKKPIDLCSNQILISAILAWYRLYFITLYFWSQKENLKLLFTLYEYIYIDR